MVGMRDVAKRAGVSLSTVSLVVNDTGYVSADMRAKIEDAMRALNYIPNELARNLYHDRTNTIGVIVPTISHPFFATLMAALQCEFASRGLRTLLCSTADASTGEAEYVDMLRRHMMDGIVMAAHTEHAEDYWTSIGRPVVAFDRRLGAGIPSVGSDHEQGGRLIAERLIAGGIRHVVTVGGPRKQFEGSGNGITFPTVRYHLTLERLVERRGIRWDYVDAGVVADLDSHARTARAILDRFPDVDAVVGSDLVASYVVQEALRRGIRVPGDLQIVAYDGTYMADAAGLPLSCIRQDTATLARRVAQLMEQAVAGSASRGGGDVESPVQEVEDTIVPVEFVPGKTTR
ncbi:LacI family DNA-binding transcriptional regulator [Bifidobacterium eulemuris]|uniref:LacI family DNA-binding transcriptional regulator n=1 Tax=Bifidobacterium eulemuris TaxID=1765219 RepID=A0A261GE67_9BIFI|nr:LacI family DNA-binding transcriptional regulator [Bifidobacterium eulemuris]OZG69694.1 LacI family transcriptional regulator [Bifidobacterium eulemuris]QOL32202.1 LacI family DNA-binding transcriptional regulator [Bifidobacterium eulemuris]